MGSDHVCFGGKAFYLFRGFDFVEIVERLTSCRHSIGCNSLLQQDLADCSVHEFR